MKLEGLGKRVRERRTARCLTQRELAAKASMSEAAVRHVETARYEPAASRVLALADALEVGVEWLLTGEGEP